MFFYLFKADPREMLYQMKGRDTPSPKKKKEKKAGKGLFIHFHINKTHCSLKSKTLATPPPSRFKKHGVYWVAF